MQNDINIFHLTRIMSLHVLPLSCYRKKLQNLDLFHLNCGPKFARFESNWLRGVASIGREDIQNTRHWSERTETARTKWAKLDNVVIASAIRQWRRW